MTATELIERAQHDAAEHDIREVASLLQDLLGQKLVAYALGDRHPKSIGRYARGDRQPADDAHRRLVDLYVVVGVLGQGMRERTVKSWMLGSNPRLKGMAPIEAFHEGRAYEVMSAASAFVANR